MLKCLDDSEFVSNRMKNQFVWWTLLICVASAAKPKNGTSGPGFNSSRTLIASRPIQSESKEQKALKTKQFQKQSFPLHPVGTNCIDKHYLCHAWASHGECSKNPVYMQRVCWKSCGVCVASGAASSGVVTLQTLYHAIMALNQQFQDFKKKHDPCHSYNILSNPQRAVTYMNSSCGSVTCDFTCDNFALAASGEKTDPQWKGAGYYRFQGPLTRMAKFGEATTVWQCNTYYPGYINDPTAHLIREGETKEGVEVCFYKSALRITISMTKCVGGYYIYKLPDTPQCYYGYCGAN